MVCEGYILAKVTCFRRRLDDIVERLGKLREVWTKKDVQSRGNSFVYTRWPELGARWVDWTLDISALRFAWPENIPASQLTHEPQEWRKKFVMGCCSSFGCNDAVLVITVASITIVSMLSRPPWSLSVYQRPQVRLTSLLYGGYVRGRNALARDVVNETATLCFVPPRLIFARILSIDLIDATKFPLVVYIVDDIKAFVVDSKSPVKRRRPHAPNSTRISGANPPHVTV